MDPADSALNRLGVIQDYLRISNKIDDIFDISFLHSTLERYYEVSNVKVVSMCLKILQESTKAMKNSYNATFESQMPMIVRGVVLCLNMSDVYMDAVSLLYDICDDKKFAAMVRSELERSISGSSSTSQKTNLESILNTIDSRSTKRAIPQPAESPRLGVLSSPIVSAALPGPLPRDNSDEHTVSSSDSTHKTSSGSILHISFIPQSMCEEWLLARTPEDLAGVLEEVGLVYSSISPVDRLRYSRDVSRVVRQTLHSLKSDNLHVTVNGLRLLEMLGEDHASEFVPDLSVLFPAVQVRG